MQEETVVTAMRLEQPISEAPGNIYVITAEDIKRSGATDIPTILRQVPGMEVMQTTAADFNVSVRGDGQLLANKLLVQVDGRSIYRDASGVVFWRILPVSLTEIEQIEVLKGPASSIHGFNAFDGVVNIITKSPSTAQGLSVQTAFGEFNTSVNSLRYGGKVNSISYKLTASFNQTNQWSNRKRLGFREYRFNVQGEYTPNSQTRISLASGWGHVPKLDSLVTQTTLTETPQDQVHVNLKYQTSGFFVQAFWNGQFGPQNNRTHPLLMNVIQVLNHEGQAKGRESNNSYDIVAQYITPLGTSHRLIGGTNYRRNITTTNLIAETQAEQRLGFYVQDEWYITPYITSIVGMRYDLDTFINPTYSPRVSILFNPIQEHTFRAEFSIGYRPPTLITTFLDVSTRINTTPPIIAQSVGSNNLSPEQIISYEVAYQGWYWQHRLRIRAAGFFNQLSDLIEFERTGSTPTDPSIAVNGGDAEIYGAEVGMEFWATSWLQGFANGAYQQIKQTITGLNRRAGPQWKVNGGLRMQWENGISSDVLIHYVSATTHPLSTTFSSLAPFGVVAPNPRLDSYILLNLRGGYRFWDDRAELAISVFNALNDRHKEHPLGDTIGSRVLGWLTISL